MYLKLDVDQLQIIKKTIEITCTDYDLYGNFLPVKNTLFIIEDLLLEINRLQEQYEDLQQDLKDNYKPISKFEYYE